jgi:hypothetical protein
MSYNNEEYTTCGKCKHFTLVETEWNGKKIKEYGECDEMKVKTLLLRKDRECCKDNFHYFKVAS